MNIQEDARDSGSNTGSWSKAEALGDFKTHLGLMEGAVAAGIQMRVLGIMGYILGYYSSWNILEDCEIF